MKCAQCNQDVHIRLIGQHQCAQQPAVPALPHGLQSHGLGSFFDASEDSMRSTGPASRYGPPHDAMGARRAVESRMFPSTYKPSLQLLDEEVSAGGDEDFDFDSMLQNASSVQPNAAKGAGDSMVSPGPRKMPDLSHSNSSVSIDSYANGLSPLDFSQIAGRTSPTANGFTLQHEGSRPANSSRLEQAREELRSALPSPSTADGSMASPRSPEYGHLSNHSSSSSPKHAPANVAALQNSLMQKMASGAVSVPASQPSPQHPSFRAPNGDSRSPLESATESALTLSSASLPSSPRTGNAANRAGGTVVSPPPLVRSWQRQNSDSSVATNNGTSAPSNNGAALRSGSSHRAQQQQPPISPIDNNERQATGSASRSNSTSPAARADSARGNDGNSLSIGSMMRAPPTMSQRKASGNDAGRQGSSPRSPTEGRVTGDSNRSNGSNNHSSGAYARAEVAQGQNHQQQQSPPPVSIDTQICISARKPSGGASGSMSASPHLPPSLSKSNSAEAPSASVDIPHGRKVTRNATAPSSMPSYNPMDVLASLMTAKPQIPLPAVPKARQPPVPPPIPQINTQIGARSQSPKRIPVPSNGATKGAGLPAVARSLKSAKLDSLLDDLMGEMQALSAEVRTESDRESMVSTASVGASATSPVDQTSGVGLAKEHAYRARLDSTVSTASTSSTLSGNGTYRRQPHCATCGVGIAAARGAVVRSSGLARGEVPAGAQGVEHAGRVYCVRDYRRQMSQTCGGCGQRCESTSSRDAVHALDTWWHRQCFNCQECRQAFPDKSFYVFENRPYCRYDYHKLNQSLCGSCQEPIEGPCAQVYEGRYHPGCFACAHCGDALRDVYYSLEGRFFCEQHVHQHKSHRSVNKRRTVFGHI
ncbi:hypothetical protein LPJ70_002054 [Coemansia sp. RSA 2708]|nr:hypothetical protein LPJ70_002054 [Coemansia sp. RSA 2708]